MSDGPDYAALIWSLTIVAWPLVCLLLLIEYPLPRHGSWLPGAALGWLVIAASMLADLSFIAIGYIRSPEAFVLFVWPVACLVFLILYRFRRLPNWHSALTIAWFALLATLLADLALLAFFYFQTFAGRIYWLMVHGLASTSLALYVSGFLALFLKPSAPPGALGDERQAVAAGRK